MKRPIDETDTAESHDRDVVMEPPSAVTTLQENVADMAVDSTAPHDRSQRTEEAKSKEDLTQLVNQAYDKAAKKYVAQWAQLSESRKGFNVFGEIDTATAQANQNAIFGLIDQLLQTKKKSNDKTKPPILSKTHASAFVVDYRSHADEEAFLRHLDQQRNAFNASLSDKSPFFAVIQSSGYGKSRLMAQIDKQGKGGYKVVYWTFGKDNATYPSPNVRIQVNEFENLSRIELEKAFISAINNAILNAIDDIAGPKDPYIAADKSTTAAAIPTQLACKVLFVVDEASSLLEMETGDGVSFYRSLRTAFKAFGKLTDKLFFVVMATFSTVTHLSPGLKMDPSFKPSRGNDANEGPLSPFILGSSFRVFNERSTLLNKSIEDCHLPACLYSMGRPLWFALLNAENAMSDTALLHYAGQKLRLRKHIDQPLSSHDETLAVMSVRLCLSISPTCKYAPSLVAGHMATALSVTDDRMSMTITYPSEPVLAVAAKKCMQNGSNLLHMLSTLQNLLAHGAVDKGYKGEIIVRLLMILAMDKAITAAEGAPAEVAEVRLADFLKQFHRDGAALDDKFISEVKQQGDATEKDKEEGNKTGVSTYLEGKVCFTHFIHLSKDTTAPLITHDLLRYAYRRTAAIVVEEGRRGIDKIIPLRIDDDSFVGLVVQDKKRISDTLESLTKVGNAETHHKVNLSYFLTGAEKQTFGDAGVDLRRHWPAMLFAIGVDEVGASVAAKMQRKRLRHKSLLETEKFDFPCIVLTGLEYTGLMEPEADNALRELRRFEVTLDERKKHDIPITYGY